MPGGSSEFRGVLCGSSPEVDSLGLSQLGIGENMQAVVTGGCGFVGSHLCRRLLDVGHDVIAIDNCVTGSRANVSSIQNHPGFRLIEWDLLAGIPDLPRIDFIYHLASPASPPAYQRHAIPTLRVNAEATRNLLDLASRTGARMLFASTSEVYGDPLSHPQREDYRGHVSSIGPRSMYDEAKRYGEALMMAYHHDLGVETRIVRIFNTYGPLMDPDDGRVVSNFIVQALRGHPLTIYGDGLQTRSFQYVDDLIEGIVRLMASDFVEPVNIGNPNEFTMLELAEKILCATRSSSRLEFRPLPDDDPVRRRPDISRAKMILDWEPMVSLDVGLMKTIPSFENALNLSSRPKSVSEPAPLSVVSVGSAN